MGKVKTKEVDVDGKIDKIYQILHDSRMWLALSNIENAKEQLATAETLVLDLRHGPSLNDKKPEGYYPDHGINDWVEVVLGNGMPPIKNCCITSVKFSQGGHVHYDILYVTSVDDDGTKNYQKLYNVPTGLINAIS